MLRHLVALPRRLGQLSPSTPHHFLVRFCTQSIAPILDATTAAEPSPSSSPESLSPLVEHVHWRVSPSDDGTRLDRFVKRQAPGLPPGLIQRLIRQRRILVSTVPAVRNAHPVRADDVVAFPASFKLGLSCGKRKPAATDLSLAEAETVRKWVLHRDARCVVLDKPAGLPSQGGSGLTGRTLHDLLPGLGAGRYWLVHRLDREVAGAMVVARDVGAAGLLAEHFRSRSVRKTYWALVNGAVRERTGFVDLPIDGKKARTDFRVVQAVDSKFSWLELSPRTGRKHQLRIHCADGLGAPIVGDGKYGYDHGTQQEVGGLESLMDPGLHLFSRRIEFPKLTQQKSGGGKRAKRPPKGDSLNMVSIAAPLPPHMKDTWKRFGLHERFGD